MSSSLRARQRNPRGAGAQLRDEIVRAATALLCRGAAVTLRAVAREVGIAPQSIYPHFGSPEQILHAVVIETFTVLQTRIEQARNTESTPRDRLMAGCRAYIAFGADNPPLYAILFGQPRTALREDAPAAGASVADLDGARAFESLVQAVQECVDDGSSTAGSVLDTAVQLWVAMHGLVQLRATEPDFPWPDAERTETELITLTGRLTR